MFLLSYINESDYHRVSGAILFAMHVTLTQAGVQEEWLVFLDPRLRGDDSERLPEVRW